MGKGVLSNREIRSAIKTGQVVVFPLDENNINTTSVDVRLGENFYRIRDHREDSVIFNPFDEEHVKNHFELQKAQPLTKVLGSLAINGLTNIPPEHLVIPMRPHERILGHTYEFIGISTEGTSSMQARSTIGRSGINVCQDAGWGDCGYVNRWTMEIYNNNDRHIVLPVGARIAQIVFYHSEGVESEYSSDTGKYQSITANDLKGIVSSWQPSDMLPKAYKDRIQEYIPLECD